MRPLAYSIPEACKEANIGRTKFYELVKEGRIRPRKVGRRSIVLSEELEAVLRDLPPMQTKAEV
jgi:excisionase family DNA binding protein